MSAGRWRSARRKEVGLLGTRPVHRVVELLEGAHEALVRMRRPRLSEEPGLISWALQLLGIASTGSQSIQGLGWRCCMGTCPPGLWPLTQEDVCPRC